MTVDYDQVNLLRAVVSPLSTAMASDLLLHMKINLLRDMAKTSIGTYQRAAVENKLDVLNVVMLEYQAKRQATFS